VTPQKYVPVAKVHRPGRSLLTVDEVAKELRVSRMTAYRRVHDGSIPALRIGRNIRVTEKALDAYIRTCAAEFWEDAEREEA